MARDSLAIVRDEIVSCRRCPRLVAWRERIAREKRRAYREWTYWGRPVPGFGDPRARLVVVGLAPAAHGGNRTGRIFTGDRSGDFLFAALHRAGFANQALSRSRDDGLRLSDCYILAVARCAPPDNALRPEEIAACSGFFDREIALLPSARAILALGAVAWNALLAHLARSGVAVPRPRPKFAHAAVARIPGAPFAIFASYHVSQQNTQTGRLTPRMLDAVLRMCRRTAASSAESKPGQRRPRRNVTGER